LYDFCNDTLSSVYLAAVKDRLYCDDLDSQRRQQTCAAMHIISDALIRLLAPFIPHTADEAWRSLHGEDAGNVHTQLYLTEAYETSDQWDLVMQTRDRHLKKQSKMALRIHLMLVWCSLQLSPCLTRVTLLIYVVFPK